jgi:AraC-like DNA-binding protein
MPHAHNLLDRFETAAALAAPLPDYARHHAIDLVVLADTVGLDSTRFGDLSTMISLDRLCRLFEAVAVVARDDTFGLDLASSYEPGMVGAFGYGLVFAPSFGAALDFATRHMATICDTQRTALMMEGAEVRFEWALPSLIVRRDQYVDFLMALFATRLRSLTEKAHGPLRIAMQRPAPRDVGVYRKRLARHIAFNAPDNAFVFSRSILNEPNPQSDPRLFQLMDAHCATLRRNRPPDSLLSALEAYIVDHIDQPSISLSEAARHMGHSERTLQRRIAELGTSFHDIVDEARRQIAMRMLQDSPYSIAEISYRLGFSQPSAFTRSARRWFDQSPSAFRRSRRAPSPDS